MINLLPSSYKKDLQDQRRMRLCVILAYAALGAVLCFALILVSTQFFIKGKLQEFSFPLENAKTELAKKEAVLQKIQSFNQHTLALSSFYQKRVFPSTVLERFAPLMGNGMSLSAFSYAAPAIITIEDKQKQEPAKISVSGFAPTRDALFAFREKLQKDSLFQNLSFPPSNWVNPVNIAFSFTASLKLEP